VAFLIKLINNIIFIFNEYSKIMPGLDVIFKKKIYNSQTDAVNGVVVFDNSSNKIFVGGDCFSSDVKDAAYNSSTNTLTITKCDNSVITVSFSGYESSSNKVTTLSDASTNTQYPSAKCVYDSVRMKPVVVWEVSTLSDGILATETDISANPNWQITNLDLTPFKSVELYIHAGGSANMSYTPSIVIEIDLDTINQSTFGHYLGSAVVQGPNDRNRLLAVSAAISSDKTSVIFNRCTSLYGTAATDANNNGRVLYKIVGNYD
jgi:hypothetical protein